MKKYPNVNDVFVHEEIGWIEVQHDGNVNWEALQKIKNDIWGEDAVAIEVYPPEKYVVNTGNWRHLWRLGDGEFYPNIKPIEKKEYDMTLAERVATYRAKYD